MNLLFAIGFVITIAGAAGVDEHLANALWSVLGLTLMGIAAWAAHVPVDYDDEEW